MMQIGVMRITVEISEDDLKELMNLTGERKKSAAVSKGVVEFIKRQRAREFGRLLREGAFDFDFTNEDVEKLDT
jgi:putative antitoxin of VapBC-like toxin-antitoxin system